MKSSLCLICGVSVFCHLAASAAPSFQADRSLPNLGLRIRILGNSAPEPLPQPQVHSYTVTRNGEKTDYDMVGVPEMWYASQHAGQWRDAAGNVMIIAQPTLQLPAVPETTFSINGAHVTRDAYEKMVRETGVPVDAASEEALTAWVAAFTGIKPSGVEKLKVPFNLTSAVFFPAADTRTLVWGFRVKARGSSGQTRPSGWYVVALQVNDGSPLPKVRQDFEAFVIANVAFVAPPAGGAAASGPRSLSNRSGAPSGNAAMAGRDEVIKSIENMDGWWYEEEANYIFLSNIRGAAGKSLIRDLKNTLPALRGAFAKVVEPFSDKTEVNVVRVFDSREAYANHVGNELGWSSGCWMPSRRELCILSQGTDNKAEKERTAVIIRHEAFHQYLFYASDGIQDAVWFNEGHACFFEAAEINAQRRVEVKEPNKKQWLMGNLDAAAQNIPFVLSASHAQFYAGDDGRRNVNYATAWGLVYFLHCGTSSGKAAAYANILTTYRKALKETRNPEAATQEAFKNVDMKAFQTAFLDFWRKGGTSKRFRVN